MCKAAKVTIAEVEEIVENGSISPEDVHVPAVYVQKVVLGKKFEKRIEVWYKLFGLRNETRVIHFVLLFS